MKTKVDFTIVTAPAYVNLMCPYCDSENTYDYDNLQEEVGIEVYFGNHGSVECILCGKEIELGEVEYD